MPSLTTLRVGNFMAISSNRYSSPARYKELIEVISTRWAEGFELVILWLTVSDRQRGCSLWWSEIKRFGRSVGTNRDLQDATLSVDLLVSLPNCNGRIATTGMCLGGHLAFRAAFDPRVLASVCFFATDIHSATLGKGKKDDSLERVKKGDLTGKGELVMIFGKQVYIVQHTRLD